jgi:hypothetical protein
MQTKNILSKLMPDTYMAGLMDAQGIDGRLVAHTDKN